MGCAAGVGCILASLEKPSKFPLMASKASSLLFSPVWNSTEHIVEHSQISSVFFQYPHSSYKNQQCLQLDSTLLSPAVPSWSTSALTPIFRKLFSCRLHHNSLPQPLGKALCTRTIYKTFFSHLYPGLWAHHKCPKLCPKLTNKQPNIPYSRNSICSQMLHTRLVYFSWADFIFNTRLFTLHQEHGKYWLFQMLFKMSPDVSY